MGERGDAQLVDPDEIRDLDRPAGIVGRPVDERVLDHLPVDVIPVDQRGRLDALDQRLRRDARRDELAHRLDEAGRVVQEPTGRHTIPGRDDELLLPPRAGEVVLADRVTNARVRECLVAVEVIPARDDGETVDAVFVVGRSSPSQSETGRDANVDGPRRPHNSCQSAPSGRV
jgi:hypothetical protein